MNEDFKNTEEGHANESFSDQAEQVSESVSSTCEDSGDSYSELLHKNEGLSGKPVIQKMKYIDQLSYPLDEVPQINLLDPDITLPLNSDMLVTSEIALQVGKLINEEETQKAKELAHIDSWNKRIEKNKLDIEKNNAIIEDNSLAILYDKKNRDYWVNRAESVGIDFENAAAANREEDWTWFIKKYGLKHSDGSPLKADDVSVEELVNGGSKNLIGQYRISANYYEQIRKDKEKDNNRMITEISKLKHSNETLASYIENAFKFKVQPLRNGITLLKSLKDYLEVLKKQEKASYSELRNWAEIHLNKLLRAHPDIPQDVVTNFRKLASIPLPAENS